MGRGDLRIVEANEVTPELVQAFERLVPQLRERCAPPTAGALGEIVSSSSTTLLLAVDGGEIVGSLTFVSFRIPTGRRARIEDVIVDAAARRRGVGRALVEEAKRRARERGAPTIDLRCRPERAEARQFYGSVGFERRDTLVFRHTTDASRSGGRD